MRPADDIRSTQPAEVWRFGRCVLDEGRREFSIDGAPIALENRVFDLLVYLLRHPGVVHPRQALIRAVWPTPFVTDTALSNAVAKLRHVLAAEANSVRLVTVFGSGYRLDIDEAAARLPSPSAAPAPASAQNPQSQTPSLAVLRVQDVTGDPACAWMADGLACLMHYRLSLDPGTRLLPLATSLHWRPAGDGPDVDVDIGQASSHLGGRPVLAACISRQHDGRFRLDVRCGIAEGSAFRACVEGMEPAALAAEAASAAAGWLQGIALRRFDMAQGWEQRLALALSREQRGELAESLSLVQAELERQPNRAELSIVHARLLRQMLRLDEADRAVDAGLATGPRPAVCARLWLERARITLRRGEYAAAEPVLNLALAQCAAADREVDGSLLSEIHTVRANVHQVMARYGEAAHVARRALTLAESAGDVAAKAAALAALGRAMMMLGARPEAARLLELSATEARAAGLVGQEAQSLHGLATTLAMEAQLRPGIAAAVRGAEVAERSGDVMVHIALQCQEMMMRVTLGELQVAQRQFDERADAIRAKSHGAYQWPLMGMHAWLLYRQGRWSEASAVHRHALQAQPEPPSLVQRQWTLWIAKALLCQGRLAEVEPMIEVARREGPAELRWSLEADWAMAHGRRADAIEALRMGWQAMNEFEIVAFANLLSLAWLLLEDGDESGLVTLMPEIEALASDLPEAEFVVAAWHWRRGDTAFDPARWTALSQAVVGLAQRHPWLTEGSSGQAWMGGSVRRLPVLLCWC